MPMIRGGAMRFGRSARATVSSIESVMPEFDEAQIERVIAACRENAGAIGESLSLCFERRYRVEVGESFLWGSPEAASQVAGPGLLVSLDLSGAGMVCTIPATLPLPDWYTHPGESEQSRLQTLAMEWSLNLVPGDLEVTRFATLAVDDLAQEVHAAGPSAVAAALQLFVFDADAGREEPAATLCLVWPVEAAPVPKPAAAPAAASKGAPQSSPARPAPAAPNAANPAPAAKGAGRAHRLLNLPVTVVVRLAEKKIEMGQLLALSPGALITFSKSCEDLLDMYVNNQLYCRGEAVKIGEKFGLKVNEVGATKHRERRVLNS